MIRWIGNILIAIAIALLICGVLFGYAYNDFSFILPLTLVFVTLLIALLLWILWRNRLTVSRRNRTALTILSYVEQALRLNLPLSQFLTAAQLSESTWVAIRIARLRSHLDRGSTITDALRLSVPGVGRRTFALLNRAQRSGRLQPELSRLVLQQNQQQIEDRSQHAFLRIYPIVMSMTVVTILFLISVFVLPKFEQIFRGFHLQLPFITRTLIDWVDAEQAPFWCFTAICLGIFVIVAQVIRNRYDLPGPGDWFTSNRDLADVCHAIADDLRGNLPLDDAIDAASDLSLTNPLRRKLRQWANGIRGGMPSLQAAARAGMPALLSTLATNAQGFEFLSRYYDAKFSRLLILLRAAAIPAMVFFFGGIVATIALALFLPLISIIYSLSLF